MKIGDVGIEGEKLPILTQPIHRGFVGDIDFVGFGRRSTAISVARVGFTLLYSPGAVGYRDIDGNEVQIAPEFRQSVYALVEVGEAIQASQDLASWAGDVITNENGDRQLASERWPWAVNVVNAWRLSSFPSLKQLRGQFGVPWHSQSSLHWGDLDIFQDREIEPWNVDDAPDEASFWRAADPSLVNHKGTMAPSDSVYAISSPLREGHLKIGCASGDAGERLEEARRWLGPSADFAVRPTLVKAGYGAAAERELHERFADRRIDGEWFRVTTAEVEAAILDIMVRRKGDLVR